MPETPRRGEVPMDAEYGRHTERVIALLGEAGRSDWTTGRYRDCYDRLASHLDGEGLGYTDEAARSWLGDVSGTLDRTTRSIYAAAIGKLGDLYAGRDVAARHRTAPTRRDMLSERNRQLVDAYCGHLRDSGLAEATVENRRTSATRLLLGLQDGGAGSVEDATYADLLAVLDGCEGMSYRSKTDYRGKMRSLLRWLGEEGVVSPGFAILVDATALDGGRFWDAVDPGTVDRLRAAQLGGSASVSPDAFLGLVGALAQEHVDAGYSKGPVADVARLGRLLYLFMDMHGLRYDPAVGRAWLEAASASMPGWELPPFRRAIMLLEQAFEGVGHDLSRAFVFRETLRDRLPGWCAPQVDAFLAEKAAEGWRRSTLDTYRTCTCRFCIFVDGIGVSGFDGLTAEHVKRFNAEDPHATPEGKNACNSRVRGFLDWLGERGELSNPNLSLALPNASAPREDLVVTLTPDERSELEGELAVGGRTSLRDRAMIELGLRMGIRASDVAGLTVGCIDWEGAAISIVQSKTGYEVNLPMPADVGNAIFRYVTGERPESGDEHVFLISRAPFTPAGAGAAQTSLRRALPDRDVPGSGFHALRKTFASGMLAAGADPHQVAEALGHHGVDTVRRYLHLDEARMRLCPLSLAESGLELEGGLDDVR